MPAVFDQRYVKRLHGPNVKQGKNKMDLAYQLVEDMRAFKKTNNCDRLVMVSDGVVRCGDGKAGLGLDGVIEAAVRSQRGTAADTVREIHRTVLAVAGGELTDDATAVCLSVE